jgi:hypothetical protein
VHCGDGSLLWGPPSRPAVCVARSRRAPDVAGICRPYVKAQKNDDRDAEGIAEAATRRTMRFVEVKSETAPTYLVRDNDGAYGPIFQRWVRAMGIRDRPISPRSPWQPIPNYAPTPTVLNNHHPKDRSTTPHVPPAFLQIRRPPPAGRSLQIRRLRRLHRRGATRTPLCEFVSYSPAAQPRQSGPFCFPNPVRTRSRPRLANPSPAAPRISTHPGGASAAFDTT